MSGKQEWEKAPAFERDRTGPFRHGKWLSEAPLPALWRTRAQTFRGRFYVLGTRRTWDRHMCSSRTKVTYHPSLFFSNTGNEVLSRSLTESDRPSFPCLVYPYMIPQSPWQYAWRCIRGKGPIPQRVNWTRELPRVQVGLECS